MPIALYGLLDQIIFVIVYRYNFQKCFGLFLYMKTLLEREKLPELLFMQKKT